MKTSLYFKSVGQGRPLVLLHGWGWNSAIWEPLVPTLSQSFQVILVDLPGFGKSPHCVSEYSFAAIARVLLEIVPEKALWLGWSLGGMQALWMAIHHPERVEKLITVAASPRFLQATDWPGVSLKVLHQFADSLTNHYEKTAADFLELQLRGSPDYENLFASLQKLFSQSTPALAALQGGLSLLQNTDFRDELNAVKCSSLHIFGERDRLVPAKVAELIKPYLPLGQCEVVAQCGHLPFLSRREFFLELVMSFSEV